MSANPFKLIEALQKHMGGDTAFAEKSYREVLAEEPDNADAHNLLGMLFEQTDRAEEALTQSDRALELRPDYPEAHNGRGLALLKLDRAKEAVAAFKKAIAQDKDYPDAYLNLCKAHGVMQDYKAALTAVDKALKLAPGNAEAQQEKARLLDIS